MYNRKLVSLREHNHMKQYEIADILNINKGVYNQYETEYVIIPIKHLNTICNYFNVSLDYVFNFNTIKQYENNYKDINTINSGKRLKDLRKEHNLTQDALAKILNISRTTITEYERGRNIIATPFLYQICKKYNISADYLLGKIDEPKYLSI